MSIHISHLNTALLILNTYNGNEPFHLFIKKYFAANKKYGSRDRKHITSLCYNYFRLGHSTSKISVEERIVIGFFLCEHQSSDFLKTIKPEWNNLIEQPLSKKLFLVSQECLIENIFPFRDELSAGIDADKFHKSFLIQPELFLRVRPGNHKRVTGKLSGAGLHYKIISEDCIELPNASKLDGILELDKDAVVQDYNSQKIAEFLKRQTINYKQQISIWDCCAASGGKSIMAYDINPAINLTVSDKRNSILENLHKRFAKAGINKYKSFVADLTTDNRQQPTEKYDCIICDAPCTGSGTWSRTPEQLLYFKKNDIKKYASLQKKIIENVFSSLKPGGQLLYSTCSVFKKENEEVVNFAKEKFNLTLEKMELFKGYEVKADTMFSALLIAPVT